MNRKIIDCIGLNCPEPVLKTRDFLAELDGDGVEVLVDNEAARSNVERFGLSQGYTAVSRKEGDNFLVIITSPENSQNNSILFSSSDSSLTREYPCEVEEKGIIYIISSDSMGQGSDELGRMLLRAFVKTIKEVSPLPEKIIFYNSGVHLTSRESDLLAPLKSLEEQGVKIFSCGTCLDYFNRKDNLLVGKLTNMYDIMDSMTRATKVITPG
jgi:selenium metabolism protein YedF